jgi:hypothetical protein
MKHIQLFEEFVNEVSGAKPAILVKLYNELSKAQNKVSLSWEFDGMEEFPHVVKFANGLESEAHRHEGDMEEFSFYLNDDGKTILGIYDLNGYAQELKTPKDAIIWCRANESVNEGTVIDIALGVATGLLGLWAVVQSLPAVGRVLGDAAEAIANKAEAKAKQAAKNQRKELIAEIIKKFDGDTRLEKMYQELTPYTQGLTKNQILDNKDRTRQLTTIGNYIKAKLTPEEMKYFTDISSMLRTGDVR